MNAFGASSCAALARRVASLSGWRRWGLAVLLGVVATLALPPIHAIPVLWIAFPGLVWLIDSSTRHRSAMAAGWWFGFGHFSTGLYWMAYPMLVDPLKFGWMIPFAVFGLGGVLGIFTGLACVIARSAAPQGWQRILALAAGWMLLEWVRGNILTGFPWNLMGSVWMPVSPVVQFGSLFGIYGLSLLTILVAAMPALLALPGRARFAANAASLSVLAAIAIWGWMRVPAGPDPTYPGIHLRLVQANISQAEIYQGTSQAADIQNYLELSRRPGFAALTAVIWPEAAVPFLLDNDQAGRNVVSLAAPPNGRLLTGTPRGQIENGQLTKLWNSLEVVAPGGAIEATYDKAHLVPFGEYVPFRAYLPIDKITAGAIDFTPGPGLRALEAKGLPPFEPLICYEAIFPGEVVAPGAHPDWLVNVTDDAWFGISSGPYQHFASARMRAVEQGLALARAANNGVTAMVDPYGRITGMIGLGARNILDTELPQPIPGRTLFARWGNRGALTLAVAMLLVAFLCGGTLDRFRRIQENAGR